MEESHAFTCPYCWQTISMMLDLSVRSQTYIQDCEVCCHPIEISYTTDGASIVSFSAESIE